MEPDAQSGGPRRARRWIGGLAAAASLAVVTAIGSGIGDEAVRSTKPEPKLISASDTEEIAECGTSLFVPGTAADEVASSRNETLILWGDLKKQYGAVTGFENVVEVSVQGESARTVTLTRFDIEVRARRRPPEGAFFVMPCGGSTTGRSLHVDLDADPPKVVASTSDPDGVADAVDDQGRSQYRPIRFPWTVSVTDPLLLYVVAKTERCDCVWRGSLTWKSGDRSGVIRIDNGGEGYRVIGSRDSRDFVGDARGWYPGR